jgi:CDP-diacylglycerol--serine O-phosphatidyltransferase
MKKIAIVPTLLTLGNAVCGFAAIAYVSRISPESADSSEGYFALAGWLIIAAMLFDGLDGYVARLSRSTSKFGAELDSLCDAISFGLAPAFLILKMGPGWEPSATVHQLLACVAALYMICALLRLARFNVETTTDPLGHKRFRGLPSPAAAGCIASLAILRGSLAGHWSHLDIGNIHGILEVWVSLGGFAVALLMVSRIPYPKQFLAPFLRGRRHFSHVVHVVLAVFVLFVLRELAVILCFWMYAIGVAARYAVTRSLRQLPQPAGMEDVFRQG